jgi:hypothetical protein
MTEKSPPIPEYKFWTVEHRIQALLPFPLEITHPEVDKCIKKLGKWVKKYKKSNPNLILRDELMGIQHGLMPPGPKDKYAIFWVKMWVTFKDQGLIQGEDTSPVVKDTATH